MGDIESNGKAVEIAHLKECYATIAPKLDRLEQSIVRLDKRMEVYIASREITCGVKPEMMERFASKENEILRRIVDLDERKVDKEDLQSLWNFLKVETTVFIGIISLIGMLKGLGVF